MNVAIAEPGEATRRLVCNPVAVIDENDTAGTPRHQPTHIEFEPAVGQVDSLQRMTLAVLPLLADVEKGDLAVAGEPFPDSRDIDQFYRIRHHLNFFPSARPARHRNYALVPMRVSSTNCSVAASIARPRRPRGA